RRYRERLAASGADGPGVATGHALRVGIVGVQREGVRNRPFVLEVDGDGLPFLAFGGLRVELEVACSYVEGDAGGVGGGGTTGGWGGGPSGGRGSGAGGGGLVTAAGAASAGGGEYAERGEGSGEHDGAGEPHTSTSIGMSSGSAMPIRFGNHTNVTAECGDWIYSGARRDAP